MSVSLSELNRPTKRAIYYPTEDGKPMAETDRHIELAVYFRQAMKRRYQDRPDVYVAGNNFIYYVQGDPKKCVSPDLYLVFGVSSKLRDCYKSWEEGGRLPDVVFEFTSKKTRREDVFKKRPLYESILRVKEFFQFDPTGDYLKPELQGFRMEGTRFQPIPLRENRLYSEQLELEMVQQGEWLRLYDPRAGEWLLSDLELSARAEEDRRKALEEQRRADEAEEEIRRLRAQIDEMRRRLDP